MLIRMCLLFTVITGLAACNLQNIQFTESDLGTVLEAEREAAAAYEKEDWQTAEEKYKYLTEHTPGEAEPWFRLGNIYARTGRLDEAVDAYRESLVRDTRNSKVWHNLGIVQLRIATNTFVEMLQYTDNNDPLNNRAKRVVNTVSDLMASGFEAPGTK